MSHKAPRPKLDLLAFFVHFSFGAFFGGFIGVYLYAKSPIYRDDVSDLSFILHVAISALVVGVVAGICRDRFWKNPPSL